MPFVNMKEAINAMPKDKPCAIGAFNYHNIEFAQAIVAGAEEENAPVILMVNEMMAAYMGIGMIVTVGKLVADNARVPVSVMLDHGKDLTMINKAIELGVSVMFDGSALAFEDNVKTTAEIVKNAHMKGVAVEAEIGCLRQSEDGDEVYAESYTTPEQAKEFVMKTSVDVLAVAVGNAHGYYKGKEQIDVALIEKIRKAVPSVPIVMHGGSDMNCDTVRNAIKAGISKFNIATDLKYAYFRTMRDTLTENLHLPPCEIFEKAKQSVTGVTRKKIRLFTCP